ncbi:hypothetical protein D7322_23155 [Sphingobacterium puteale]|uniref:Uncharacterized protein n=1 Tax=Sphingobacterium puteale TaxID=2420510 RepID=A0A420VS02_9SPHI|nr:hypothetical protein [Sphingobacterium puteale]RKO69136.1 hypothetical protein D7322_23155 [Sphingobacterium puteale]
MRTIIKIIGVIALLLLVFDQSRSIYRLDDSHYITVWKRLGNKCFITLDKHYSIFKPSKYIETTNDNFVTIVIDKQHANSDFVLYSRQDKAVNIVGYQSKIIYNNDEYDEFKKQYYENNNHKIHHLYFSIDIKEKLISKFSED